MDPEQFIENLLTVLPYWQYKLVIPFRHALKSEMGISAYYALQTLRQFGMMSMTELARRLKITKQQATKIVDGLCAENLARRCSDSTDRRYIHIDITEEGKDALFQIFRQDLSFFDKLEQKIGAEDLAELEKAIEILLRVLPKLD